MVKNCDLGLENAALGLRPTDLPAGNNIYVFVKNKVRSPASKRTKGIVQLS